MDHAERIAIALERIADALEAQKTNTTRRDAVPASESFLRAMERNRDKLVGRMTAQQIADAIGMELGRSDRVAFGQALTRYGASKIKSGAQRSYQFGCEAPQQKVPGWLLNQIDAKRGTLRGHMSIQAAADILGIPKLPHKLSELRHNLIALGYSADGGLFNFG